MPDPTRSQWLQTLDIISSRQPDQAEAGELPASRVTADTAVIVKATVPAFTRRRLAWGRSQKYFCENMSEKSENRAYRY